MWFKTNPPPAPSAPDAPTYYPDGLAVSDGEREFFIKGGKRYRFYSPRVRDSWKLNIIDGSKESLSRYKIARGPMGFRDGTLIHNFADGKMYLISNNKRRLITNPDVLDRYNLTPIEVSKAEVELHEEGDELD